MKRPARPGRRPMPGYGRRSMQPVQPQPLSRRAAAATCRRRRSRQPMEAPPQPPPMERSGIAPMCHRPRRPSTDRQYVWLARIHGSHDPHCLAAALSCGFFLAAGARDSATRYRRRAAQNRHLRAAPDAAIKPRPRPRIALVLSGGGARGFAHIGVLRALQELRIPVDIVVGTSMGSVVGGAYAAGSSVEQLEQTGAPHRLGPRWWPTVPRAINLEFRRREEDLLLPSRIEFGAHLDGVSLPPAAAGNAALELALTPAAAVRRPRQAGQPAALPFPLGRLRPGHRRAGGPERHAAVPDRCALRWRCRACLRRCASTSACWSTAAWCATCRSTWRTNGRRHHHRRQRRHAAGAGKGIEQRAQRGAADAQILTEQNVQRSLKELRPQDILLAPAWAASASSTSAPRPRDEGRRAGGARDERAAGAAGPAGAAVRAVSKTSACRRRWRSTSRWSSPDQAGSGAGGRINPRELEVQSGLKVGQMHHQRAGAARPATSCSGAATWRAWRPRSRRQGRPQRVTIKPTEARLGAQPPARGPGAEQRFRRRQFVRAEGDACAVLAQRLGRGAAHRGTGRRPSARWARSSGSRWARARSGMWRRRWNTVRRPRSTASGFPASRATPTTTRPPRCRWAASWAAGATCATHSDAQRDQRAIGDSGRIPRRHRTSG
jgi:hypothetical protein